MCDGALIESVHALSMILRAAISSILFHFRSVLELHLPSRRKAEFMKDMEVPEFVHSIPDDADEATKRYMRAQAVIGAAFHSFGDQAGGSGTATLCTRELERVLATALGMLISIDPQVNTRTKVRSAVDHHARYVRSFVDAMHRMGDTTPQTILDALHLQRATVN